MCSTETTDQPSHLLCTTREYHVRLTAVKKKKKKLLLLMAIEYENGLALIREWDYSGVIMYFHDADGLTLDKAGKSQ